MLAVVKVGVVKAPLKLIVPVVLVSTTLVPVVTMSLKLAPPELVIVRLDTLAVPPIAPSTLIVPPVPALSVKASAFAEAPFTVLPRLIFAPVAPAAVVFRVTLVPKVIGSLKFCAPLVLMEAPLSTKVPPLSVVILASAVVAPIVLPKVVVPELLTVKA